MTLRLWLQARSGRERAMLAIALGLALAWLGLTLGLRPVLAWRAEAQAQIARIDAVRAALGNPDAGANPGANSGANPARANPARANASANPAPPGAPARPARRDTPAARAVTDSAAPFGLTIRRLEADGPATRVVLDEAPFDALIGWIAALERAEALRVTDILIDRRPGPGLVAAQITLAP